MEGVFVHPQALCESAQVGAGTRVWAFAHVLPRAVIGRNCNICDGVFVENDVIVGDDVTVKCGVQLWDGVRLADGVFVGPNATFTNDLFPRSKAYPERFPETHVERGASIGANATVLPGLRIGQGAMIGAGAVVTRDVPPFAVVVGNPGRVVGYAHAQAVDPAAGQDLPADFPAKILHLRVVDEARGRLCATAAPDLPFAPRRVFIVDKVPLGEARGIHAHRVCHQLLSVAHGALTAVVDDGRRAFAVRLATPGLALHVPPGVWGTQLQHTPDAVLTVLASEPYDRDDYLSTYDDFRAHVGALNVGAPS